jgi:pyruvate carboxylase subunit B
MKDYFMPPEATAVEPMIPWSPMPGGALTSNTQMMRDNDIMDRFPEVIADFGEVVRRGGFGTSVTPVSQFYFQQAFNNVMLGKWKKIAEGYGKMVLGYFGKTPIEPDAEIVSIASEQLGLEPAEGNPLDIIEKDPGKSIAAAKKKLTDNGIEITDENIFIVSACGDKGINYLLGKGTIGVRKKTPGAGVPRAITDFSAKVGAGTVHAQTGKTSASGGSAGTDSGRIASRYTVTVNDNRYAVRLDGDTAVVNGRMYRIFVAGGIDESGISAPAVQRKRRAVRAPMPGTIVRLMVSPGDSVREGDPLIVQEAMKMEMSVAAPVDGTIADITVSIGDYVKSEQVLLYIG